jgi:hypothetical protein
MNIAFRKIFVCFIAVFVAGAVASAAAQAAEGPFYKAEGVRLAGEKELTSKQKQNYTLTGSGVSVTCEVQALATGAKVVGSTGKNAGTSTETVEFSKCKVTGNGATCPKVKEPIATKPLTNRLGYASETRTGKLLTLLKPVEGPFVTLTFEPVTGNEKCTFKTTAVSGSVAGEDFAGGKAVEVGVNEVEGAENELKFPGARETNVWTESSGVLTKTTAKLTAFGVTSTLKGNSGLTLPGVAKWGVCTKVAGPAPAC